MMRDVLRADVLLAIRADEGHHREVNHTLGSMRPSDLDMSLSQLRFLYTQTH